MNIDMSIKKANKIKTYTLLSHGLNSNIACLLQKWLWH